MPPVLRGLLPSSQRCSSTTCRQCWRTINTTAALGSGHNKWSKIRHVKAAADAKKNSMRSQFSKNIVLYTKLYGPNVDSNPQLGAVLAAAKKAGVPKATIEGAIARAQGRTAGGAALEAATLEVIMPPSVALIVDIETDSKIRSIKDLNNIVSKAKGRTASSKFFFSRVGRVVFEKSTKGISQDQILDDAIEAGAEDVETDDEGNIIVWSGPTDTNQISKTIGAKFGLGVLESQLIWSANADTKVTVDSSDDLRRLGDLAAALQEYPDVQAVWCNADRGNTSDEEWARLEENIDS